MCFMRSEIVIYIMADSVFIKRYQDIVVPKLKEQFSYTNVHQIPKIERIVVNVGVGRLVTNRQGSGGTPKDKGKGKEGVVEDVVTALAAISGQKPKIVLARKSVAGFKLREGTINGVVVTLRKKNMQDFFVRFIDVTLPRSRDFRGIRKEAVDKRGNLTIGVRESVIFPELAEATSNFGMEVTFVTSAKTQEEGTTLLGYMGVPFQKNDDN